MSKGSSQSKERDVFNNMAQNKTSLQHAEDTRLVKSWLSGGLGGTLSDDGAVCNNDDGEPDHKLDRGIEVEEDEVDDAQVQADMEGIGYYQPPGSTTISSSGLPTTDRNYNSTTTEKLRKQMLGSRARDQRLSAMRTSAVPPTKLTASKPLPVARMNAPNRKSYSGRNGVGGDDDDDDEDLGRSAVGTSRSHQIKTHPTAKPGHLHLISEKSADDNVDNDEFSKANETGAKKTTILIGTLNVKKRSSGGYLDDLLAQRERKKNRKKADVSEKRD